MICVSEPWSWAAGLQVWSCSRQSESDHRLLRVLRGGLVTSTCLCGCVKRWPRKEHRKHVLIGFSVRHYYNVWRKAWRSSVCLIKAFFPQLFPRFTPIIYKTNFITAKSEGERVAVKLQGQGAGDTESCDSFQVSLNAITHMFLWVASDSQCNK